MSLANSLPVQPSLQTAHLALKHEIAKQLAADTTELLYQQPFLAMLLMRLELKVVIDDRLQTAATDGKAIYADARFMQQLPQQARIFVLAHEVWHCAMGHFARRQFLTQQGRDPQRWNEACDYEVNYIVCAQLNYLPDFVLYDKRFCGMSAEQIFAKLEAEPASGQSQFDCHQPQADAPDSDSAHALYDPEYTPGAFSPADANRWRQYVAQATQVMRSRDAHISYYAKLAIERLLRPKLAWTAILRRYVEQSFGGGQTWHPINRRYAHQGLIMPGQRTPKLSIAVAIDTSGSTKNDLTQFFSELYAILKSFQQVRLQLIECDSSVRQHAEFNERDLHKITNWQAKGGGGTSFMPVFEYISNGRHIMPQPNLMVFFTDGVGDAPRQSPAYPVLWVLTADGIKPSHQQQAIRWGQYVYLKDKGE